MWGAVVAIVANGICAVGMAMQKFAHTLVERRVQASAKISDEAAAAARAQGFLTENRWWAGFIMQLGGEIGNLIAYGDPNSPASVVAAMGCTGVLVNATIASLILGEGFGRKDIFGVLLIIIGVVLIIEFVPHTTEGGARELLPCPIAFLGNFSAHACELPSSWPLGDSILSPHGSGVEACETHGLLVVGSDYWYFIQPVWLCYLFATICAIIAAYVSLQKWGPKHVASYMIIADLMGGYTICASVTISSFLFTKVFAEGKWYVLAEPIFWICVIVLAITLPVQVNYLNKSLAEYDASIVIPTHYVIFTLSSIGAPSVLYQELTLDPLLLSFHNPFLMVSLFMVGIGLTCAGVYILSVGKERTTLSEISAAQFREEGDQIKGLELPIAPGSGSLPKLDVRDISCVDSYAEPTRQASRVSADGTNKHGANGGNGASPKVGKRTSNAPLATLDAAAEDGLSAEATFSSLVVSNNETECATSAETSVHSVEEMEPAGANVVANGGSGSRL